MTTSISTRRLEPGDILLSLGISKTSIAIRALDGGDYSHAALWTGAAVIESTTPCVQELALDDSLGRHPREYIDAYRYKTMDRAKASIVVNSARAYVGRAYAYGDLFLCASLMALATGVPKRGQVRLLKEACEFFHFMTLDHPTAGEHVTCTQLVVRAYDEAGLPLHILPTGPDDRIDFGSIVAAVGELARESVSKDISPNELAEAEREEWLALQAALRAKCAALDSTAISAGDVPKGPLRLWDGRSPVTAKGQWRSNLVTPRNLQKSCDLDLVGRLYSAEGAARSLQPGTPAR